MEVSTWPKQLVPQMAENSQIQGAIRYSDPRSHFLKASKGLATCKRIIIVPEMGCHGDQSQ